MCNGIQKLPSFEVLFFLKHQKGYFIETYSQTSKSEKPLRVVQTFPCKYLGMNLKHAKCQTFYFTFAKTRAFYISAFSSLFHLRAEKLSICLMHVQFLQSVFFS